MFDHLARFWVFYVKIDGCLEYDAMMRTRMLVFLLLLSMVVPGSAEGSGRGLTSSQLPPDPGSISNPIPRLGDQPLLVLLVDFLYLPGRFDGRDWEAYFFDAGGFVDFFWKASYGQLRYSAQKTAIVGAMGEKDAMVDAYIRLPNRITYYANGQYGYDMDAFPRNNGGVVYHALLELDRMGFDFSPYANPYSGMVENLVVIFAGLNYMYTGNAYTSLEATAYRLADAGLGGEYVSRAGQRFNNYTICPELYSDGGISRVGLCAHEHGHGLGMYDLYNTAWTTTGVGLMDLMGYGLYGADWSGSIPFLPSVVTKEWLGWSEPVEYLEGTRTVWLYPAEEYNDFIRLYPRGDPTSDEYFLLENRQPRGFDAGWEQAGLCPGLLIWHVDRSIVSQYATVNQVNAQGCAAGVDCPAHPGVVLVEADGNYDMLTSSNLGECDDTWTAGRTWDDVSTPSARLWDGRASRLAVTVLGFYKDSDILELAIDVQPLSLDYSLFLPVITR